MKLNYEWQLYDHDYEKEFQDIRLVDGTELIECWPNAGKWLHCRTGKLIPDEIVTHVRLTKDEDIT